MLYSKTDGVATFLWLPNLSLRAYPCKNGYFFFPTLVIQVSFLITPHMTSYPIFNPMEEDLLRIVEFSYIGPCWSTDPYCYIQAIWTSLEEFSNTKWRAACTD
jgi:hypothetical protein